jgi:hypothetical protein
LRHAESGGAKPRMPRADPCFLVQVKNQVENPFTGLHQSQTAVVNNAVSRNGISLRLPAAARLATLRQKTLAQNKIE